MLLALVALFVLAAHGQTLCEQARTQHAALKGAALSSLDTDARRRLRILEATVRRCSTVSSLGVVAFFFFFLSHCTIVGRRKTPG